MQIGNPKDKELSPDQEPREQAKMPRWARGLGVAGLIPQALMTAIIFVGPSTLHSAAAALALGYAALILSFIGGAWWGLASHSPSDTHPSLWVAAVLPTLIAFAAFCIFVITAKPAPGLTITGIALIGTIMVDRMLATHGISPVGWLRLRVPLSLGLGSLTVLIANLT